MEIKEQFAANTSPLGLERMRVVSVTCKPVGLRDTNQGLTTCTAKAIQEKCPSRDREGHIKR